MAGGRPPCRRLEQPRRRYLAGGVEGRQVPGEAADHRQPLPPGDRPGGCRACPFHRVPDRQADRKSTRLNSSHVAISYAVFCLKKKKNNKKTSISKKKKKKKNKIH